MVFYCDDHVNCDQHQFVHFILFINSTCTEFSTRTENMYSTSIAVVLNIFVDVVNFFINIPVHGHLFWKSFQKDIKHKGSNHKQWKYITRQNRKWLKRFYKNRIHHEVLQIWQLIEHENRLRLQIYWLKQEINTNPNTHLNLMMRLLWLWLGYLNPNTNPNMTTRLLWLRLPSHDLV